VNHQKSANRTQLKKKAPRIWLAFALIALVGGTLVAFQIVRQQSPSKRSASGAQPTPQMTKQELKDVAWDPQ